MNIYRRILTVICITLALLALLVVKSELKSVAASTDPNITTTPGVSQSQQPQPPQAKEKTIGETQKNIKVLNDLPASELIPMMNLMAASLGVKCGFCHVNKNGQWDFPLDDKPEKNTAREMIAMTLNINKTAFKGNTEVSCFSCHRGRTRPVSLVELPVPEPTPRPTATAVATQPPAQPTSDDVLNKFTAAIGGQAAIDKLKTSIAKGTYTLADGSTGSYEITQSAPNKFHIVRGVRQGTTELGYNGTDAWQKDSRGVSDVRGDQLVDFKTEGQLFRNFKLREQYTRVNIRRDKIDGKDVFAITGVRPDKKRERLFFDAETGLLLRRMGFTETPLGLVPEQTDFEDYRDVDGVKVPFTVKIYVVGGFSTATRKFSEIKFNVPVDDAQFNKPAVSAAAPAKQ